MSTNRKNKLSLTRETIQKLHVKTALKAGNDAPSDQNVGVCATEAYHGCHSGAACVKVIA